MSSIDFEEYRQPWETGPHWELKREFLKTYENDYPIDRLLCLAQAYSNIELLHCSYPEPVMHEVQQCSYNLKGNKRFQEMQQNLEKVRKEEPELQAKKGKRMLSEDGSTRPFKMIKFCSAIESNSTTESENFNEHVKALDTSISCKTDLSTNDSVLTNSEKHLTNKNSNVCSDIGEKQMSPAISKNGSNIIYSFMQSPDFSTMKKISENIPNKFKSAFNVIDSIIQMPDFEGVIRYVFVPESASVHCCQFYIGNSLVSTGRDSNDRLARIQAAEYAVEILKNLSNLPNKTLNDIKQEWQKLKRIADCKEPLFSNLDLKSDAFTKLIAKGKSDPCFTDLYMILTVIEQIQKYMDKKMPASQIIQHAVTKSTSDASLFYFNFSEEPNTPLHLRMFHCDLVIGNVLICRAKSSSKKKSRSEAAEHGLISLAKFFDFNYESEDVIEEINHGTQNNVQVHSSIKNNTSTSVTKNINQSTFPEPNTSSIVPSEKCNSNLSLSKVSNSVHPPKVTDSSLKTSGYISPPSIQTQNSEQIYNEFKTETKFKINEKLLRNSYEKNLVVFDSSEIDLTKVHTPAAILSTSMNKSGKKMDFNININEGSTDSKYCCTITVNKEVFGTGVGSSERSAKLTATQDAVEFMQSNFYTIKIKKEVEDSFIITRQQVVSAQDCKSIISDNNIGCKMLKMMGWTGGAIGKSGGIIEPIVANQSGMHQGLGFSNNNSKIQNFKQKIQGLLKDYSLSRTTSDLIFSTDFSKEERKEIHQLTSRYNLHSKSIGKDESRQLFVRKKHTVKELLDFLVEAGGSTHKYELVDKSCETSGGSTHKC
ncbi:uncharacterized protein NPIL_231301 [Nephila pilipes]|uniref:NF-kappa-B-repressing factor n=1 Tax=Nephila pilipes TaxID=299642 RepID=A0A8X6IZH9_NEPPI|nr:uncharacterized protein NPIL_231301 [Nephila pilipes]